MYQQSTGDLFHINDQTGVGTYVGTGYSGHGIGFNNPILQGAANVGPIPQGTYNIGPPHDQTGLGPTVMNLDPMPGTNTYWRDLF